MHKAVEVAQEVLGRHSHIAKFFQMGGILVAGKRQKKWHSKRYWMRRSGFASLFPLLNFTSLGDQEKAFK
jgi:hypothetical protein